MLQFDNCHRGFLVYLLFHCYVLHSLFDYNLELRLSSLTLGNVSELLFLSLNRDLSTIINIQSLLPGLVA